MKRYKSLYEMASRFENTIFYQIFDSIDPNQLHLTGDTFDIKDEIKKFGMTWDSINKSWVFKQKPSSEHEFERKTIEVFKHIESLGYSIAPTPENEHLIKGYEKKKELGVQKGIPGKNRIIIKDFHHYAPMTMVKGGGTKYIKSLLQQFGFEFSGYGWQRIEMQKAQREEFVSILERNGYTIEFENIETSKADISRFIREVHKLDGQEVYLAISRKEERVMHYIDIGKEPFKTPSFKLNVAPKGITFSNLPRKELQSFLFDDIESFEINTKRGHKGFTVVVNQSDGNQYEYNFG